MFQWLSNLPVAFMKNFDQELDACGLKCPLPTLRASKALAGMVAGQVLHVIATDSGTTRDLPAYIKNSGNELLEQYEDAGKFYFLLRKV
ncbi:Molybdopterin biosynthesis protein MoeB [hydrothermal vent metagenome]|uniref:Molybdopterin biosynthesis protein MoeB n=1 Tax=hydrothermal vent metagenome TaxID=652676 RepID=A0A3B1BWZ3_9ZZZZ